MIKRRERQREKCAKMFGLWIQFPVTHDDAKPHKSASVFPFYTEKRSNFLRFIISAVEHMK